MFIMFKICSNLFSLQTLIVTPLNVLGISNHICFNYSASLILNTITKLSFCRILYILLFASNFNPLKTSRPNHAIEILKL
jgi:hypothetical protein